jgi:fructose-1-phosphate kinase PfkB-like protein
VLKTNWDEFAQSFGRAPETLEELAKDADSLVQRFQLPALVVTWGEKGRLAVTPQGAFHARPPAQVVVSAAGAGDAASGALAWRLAEGDPWPQALRWAAAVSAASVLTEGTSDLHMEDVNRIFPEVVVKELT